MVTVSLGISISFLHKKLLRETYVRMGIIGANKTNNSGDMCRFGLIVD